MSAAASSQSKFMEIIKHEPAVYKIAQHACFSEQSIERFVALCGDKYPEMCRKIVIKQATDKAIDQIDQAWYLRKEWFTVKFSRIEDTCTIVGLRSREMLIEVTVDDTTANMKIAKVYGRRRR